MNNQEGVNMKNLSFKRQLFVVAALVMFLPCVSAFAQTTTPSPGATATVSPTPAPTLASGILAVDETWDGRVLVTGDVTVPDGLSLTIQAGTLVEFTAVSDDMSSGADNSRCELIIEGILEADGEAANEIIFTSDADTPEPRDYYGIRFLDPADELCVLDYCQIAWAYIGVELNTASPAVTNNVISDCYFQGISGSSSEVDLIIEGNEIFNVGVNNDGHGIYIDCFTDMDIYLNNNHSHDNYGRGIYCYNGNGLSNINYYFTGNLTENNARGGIYVYAGNSSNNVNFHFQDETASSNGGDGIQVRSYAYGSNMDAFFQSVDSYDNDGNGVHLYFDRISDPTNVELRDCNLYENAQKGIYAWGSGDPSSALFSMCAVYGNEDEGCYFRAFKNFLAEGNAVYDNLDNGLHVRPSSNAAVEFQHNDIYNNASYGVYCNGSSPLFIYNEIHENLGGGVWYQDEIATFVQNDIYMNGTYGVYFNNVNDTQAINGNNIYDNTDAEIYNNTGHAVDARCNYWGVSTTNEMNTMGYSANLSALHDIHDDISLGMIDYRGWKSTALDTSVDPVSYIIDPLDGITVSRGVLDIEGVACATSGIDIVEVTRDGGMFWLEADGKEDWSFPWYASASGIYNLNSRAYDDDSVMETPGAGIFVEVDSDKIHTLGDLFLDETWSGDVFVTGDVTVPNGVTLTILPGTTVTFAANRDDMIGGMDTSRCELIVKGILNATGTSGDEIVFTSDYESLKDWHGIRFVNPVDAFCILDHCDIQWAHAGIILEDASPTIMNSSVSHCLYRGITGETSEEDMLLQGNDIFLNGSDGDGYGVYLSYRCSLTFDDNHIYENFNNGVYCVGFQAVNIIEHNFMNNVVNNNGDTGVYMRVPSSSQNVEVNFQNDIFFSNNDHGVFVDFDPYGTNLGATFNGVTSYDNDDEGIKTAFDRDNAPRYVEIYSCEVYENIDFGIEIWGGVDDVTVQDTSVYENAGIGCYIRSVEQLDFSNNSISENLSDGLWLRVSDPVSQVYWNDIYSNGEDGIHCEYGNIEMKYNEIRKNGIYGIEFEYGTGTFTHNNIYLNAGYGVMLKESGDICKFHFNNLFRNETYEMYNDSARPVDARLNWWGDVTTAQMDAQGYSVDIAKIYDIHDDFTLGQVDYRGWIGMAVNVDKDPASHIIEPMDGMVLPKGPVDIYGIAVSTVGIDHVDVSTDGGNDWDEVLGEEHWIFPWFAGVDGTYNIRSRAVDTDLNLESPVGPGITVDVDTDAPHTWGTLYEDETWSGSMVITGDITIPAGNALTILPGTDVIFAAERDDTMSGVDESRCELIVEGSLIADGDAADEITFTVNSVVPERMDWYGIRFVESNDAECVLDHCNIQWAYTGVMLDNSSPEISHCSISNCYYQGISGSTSDNDITISDSEIFENGMDNDGYGIILDCGEEIRITLNGNHVHDNFSSGIHFSKSNGLSDIHYILMNNTVHDNDGHGVRIWTGNNTNNSDAFFQNEYYYNNYGDGLNFRFSDYSTDTQVILDNVTCRANTGDGMYLEFKRNNEPVNLELYGCESYENDENGIKMFANSCFVSTLTCSDCYVHDNGEAGCRFEKTEEAIVSHNTIGDNDGDGLWMKLGGENVSQIFDNQIFDNGGMGLHVENGDAVFSNNAADHNISHGIEFSAGLGVFHYNDINWNGGYGIRLNNTSDVTDFDYNNLYLNNTYEMYNDSSYDVSAMCCWWGDAATQEMNDYGFPHDISRIYDNWDSPSRGLVNYSGWQSGPLPTLTPTVAPTATPAPPTLTPTISPTMPSWTITPTLVPPTATPVCWNDGDVDDSGVLTPLDALMSFRIYLGVIPDPTFDEFCSADCLGEGNVTPADAQCIFEHYLGMECDCADPVGKGFGDDYAALNQRRGLLSGHDEAYEIQERSDGERLDAVSEAGIQKVPDGFLYAELDYNYTTDLLLVSIRMRNDAELVQAFGFQVSFDESVLNYKEYLFGEMIEDWAFMGSNYSEGNLTVGAFDAFSGIKPGSEGVLALFVFEVRGISERFDFGIDIHGLADDIGEYETTTYWLDESLNDSEALQ